MQLPSEIRGKYTFDAPIGKTSWFHAGGTADVLFRPADTEDLQYFLQNISPAVPVTIIGATSNILIRDGGIRGVVIKLGKGFTHLHVSDNTITAGAAVLDTTIAQTAAENGIGALAFLTGIPGSIGGAVKMNAGCFGGEIQHCFQQAIVLDKNGTKHLFTASQCGFSYRHSAIPDGWIITEVTLQGSPAAKPEDIWAEIKQIREARAASQPEKGRTGGSTFKNPDNAKAWELIDAAGCRGLTKGGAQMSPKHCNFMLNIDNASAKDLEDLGETVRQKVKEKSGISLEWEIRRLGEYV